VKNEPVLIAQAVVAVAAVIGLDLSLEETGVVVAALAAVAAWVRSKVSPV
jgi:hypothetical protein